MAQIMPIKVQLDTAPLSTITNTIADFATQCSTSIKDITEALARVSDTLCKLGINVFTPEGEYRNIGNVLDEAYHNYPKLTEEERVGLLGAITLDKSENSNEKESFDFLKQNAYNDIDHIFEDIPKPEYITPLDL